MTIDHKLESKLEQLAQTIHTGPSMTDRVMAAIENRSIAPVTFRDRLSQWLVRPAVSVPAYVLIAGMIWILFFNNPGTLYAQVLKAVKAAQTVHVTGKAQQGSQWEPAYEIWYKRNVGVVEQTYRNRETFVRIDNGKFQWKYSSGKKSATKTLSEDPVGVVSKILNHEEFRHLLSGEPADATSIDGIPCQRYQSVNTEHSIRTEVWIDERKLPLLYKETRLLEDGSERVVEHCRFEYNVPIDDSRFEPDFGPDVTVKEIIPTGDGKALYEQRFSLENAIYSEEVMGLVYAVHELKRFDDRLVFLLSSLRPSEETIREFGPTISKKKLDITGYGSYHMYMKGKKTESGGWRVCQKRNLASINHDGLVICYDLMILKGDWPEKIETFDICPYIRTQGKLWEKYEKEGKKPHHNYQPLVTLPLPREDAPLSDIVSAVYMEMLSLEPLVSRPQLYLRAVQKPDEPKYYTVSNRPPSRLTNEEFLEEVMADYERYMSWK